MGEKKRKSLRRTDRSKGHIIAAKERVRVRQKDSK